MDSAYLRWVGCVRCMQIGVQSRGCHALLLVGMVGYVYGGACEQVVHARAGHRLQSGKDRSRHRRQPDKSLAHHRRPCWPE
jgi:hypothetical protein